MAQNKLNRACTPTHPQQKQQHRHHKMTDSSSSTIILYDQAALQTKATDLAKEINSSGTAQPLASFTPNKAAPVKKVSLVCVVGGREGGEGGREGGGESFPSFSHVMRPRVCVGVCLVLCPLPDAKEPLRSQRQQSKQ